MRRWISFGLLLAACACGGKSPSSPGESQHPLYSVTIFPGSGSYTATFNGKTYSDLPQNLQVRLAPGIYTIEGTFRGQLAALAVAISTTEGSVATGSVRLVQGPSGTTVTNCGVSLFNNSLGTASIPYRIEFRVQSTASGACRIG